ncbi:MAG: acyl-CoA dehydrogenase family protein [Pseudomonadota bacterium]
MNVHSGDRTGELVNAARRFAADHVVEAAADWERERRMPAELFKTAAEAGLLGLMVPPEAGGHGLGLKQTAAIDEVLAGADMALAFAFKVHGNLAGNLARNGSPAQIERYLKAMLTGEVIGAFLLTEPRGGSDATAITTRARPDGDGWVLDGEKAWVSNGAVAGVMLVFAQTDPAKGWRGIAGFLVDADTPGIKRQPAYHMLSGHALGTCGVTFEGVQLSRDAMLLEPEAAFKGAMGGIDIARIGVGAMAAGMMAASLDAALAHTRERAAFGQTIADFQGVQWQLAEAATDLEATRLLTGHAADLFDAGENATVAAAHAKKFGSRAAVRTISKLTQIMGAIGFRHDAGHPLARHLASAKMAEWLDGANEIQNLVIARSLLRD